MERKTNEYALYQEDDLLAIGTIKEISKELGLKEQSIRRFTTKSYAKQTIKNRKILIKL